MTNIETVLADVRNGRYAPEKRAPRRSDRTYAEGEFASEMGAWRKQLRQCETRFRDDLALAVGYEYGLTQAQSVKVVEKAWEDGHSYGLEQVLSDARETAGFAREILDCGA